MIREYGEAAGGRPKATGQRGAIHSLQAAVAFLRSLVSVPVADPAGVVIDTTTYDNPVPGGSGKLTTLVFPGDAAAVAVAIDGDDYPRWLLTSDPTDGLYMGDGTFDPYTSGDGASLFIRTNAPHTEAILAANDTQIEVGTESDTDVGPTVTVSGHKLDLGVNVSRGGGDPNGAEGGAVGDIYIRAEGTPANVPPNILYQCTVAGPLGTAVWVGVL